MQKIAGQKMPHKPSFKVLRKKAYQAANPLGGPAKMFDAIADRLRAGDSFDAVINDYGIRFVKRKKHAKKIQPQNAS